jgi:hypothetical protein
MGIKASANTSYAKYSNLTFLCGYDEGTGNTTELIQTATGTVTGATWGTIDPTYGNFLTYGDAAGDECNFGDNANWDGDALTAMTVLALVKTSANNATSDRYIGAKDGSGTPWQARWLGANDDWHAQLTTSVSTYSDAITDGLLNESGNWNVVGFTWDGSTITARVNTTKGAGTATSGTLNGNDTALVTGNKRADTTEDWNGDIAIFAIYDTFLTDTEWNAVVSDPLVLFREPDNTPGIEVIRTIAGVTH